VDDTDTVKIFQSYQNLIQEIFRTKKNKLNTQYDLLKFYIGLIKNICGDLKIVHSTKGKTRANRNYFRRIVYW
jgi:hypothetical protein